MSTESNHPVPAPERPILEIEGLGKTYPGGLEALRDVDLTIRRGEIFALLGPNGAGKTTLIGSVCGMVRPTAGSIRVDGFDLATQGRAARARIGLVPQELHTDMFEPVGSTVAFSRGLFGLAPAPEHVEKVLRDLSLWEKRKDKIMTLSGGMKRRVMIAKALSHEPDLLFLDERTAGVDVELRRSMWELVHRLREGGVTIVLTTHYIEEAEEMADRIGVISIGRLIALDDTAALMGKLGRKELRLQLQECLQELPTALVGKGLELASDGWELVFTFDTNAEHTGVASLLRDLSDLGIGFKDLATKQSSLEEIFVGLVRSSNEPQGENKEVAS